MHVEVPGDHYGDIVWEVDLVKFLDGRVVLGVIDIDNKDLVRTGHELEDHDGRMGD